MIQDSSHNEHVSVMEKRNFDLLCRRMEQADGSRFNSQRTRASNGETKV